MKLKLNLPILTNIFCSYWGADKSLARPTSRCILIVRIFRLMLVLLYTRAVHKENEHLK